MRGQADQEMKHLWDSLLTAGLMALVYVAAAPMWVAFNSYRVDEWLGDQWNG
jgi:hypothetical protein